VSGLTLELAGEQPAGFDLGPVQRAFAALAASELGLPAGQINAAFTDDAHIREVNRQQAGHDYATDVLSFSYIEDGGEAIDGVVGELFVSLETAARQAAAAGISLEEEVALLVLHGCLHILGYDHQTPDEQALVQEWQNKLMTAAGNQYREFVWSA
jgi:probable rRNA maturation factor